MQTQRTLVEAELTRIDPDAVRQMWIDDTPLARLETPNDWPSRRLSRERRRRVHQGEAISVNGGAFMD